MARKRGTDADSRADLLDAAWQLVLERGTAGMSVDAIVGRAGLSKGTFFHFFPSKQDFLDALCARIADESWRSTGAALERRGLDPIARLDLFLRASRSWRTRRSRAIAALWRELARPENSALRARVHSLGIDRLTPHVVRVLAEAGERGGARVGDPETVGRLLVEWVFAAAEGTMRILSERPAAEAVEHAVRRVDATMRAFERILGVPEGSFRRVDGNTVSRLAAGFETEGTAGAGRAALRRGDDARRRNARPGRKGVRS